MLLWCGCGIGAGNADEAQGKCDCVLEGHVHIDNDEVKGRKMYGTWHSAQLEVAEEVT